MSLVNFIEFQIMFVNWLHNGIAWKIPEKASSFKKKLSDIKSHKWLLVSVGNQKSVFDYISYHFGQSE